MGRVLVVLIVVAVAVIALSMATRQRRVDSAIRGLMRRTLEAHGAARCIAALAVLRQLRDLASAETIAGAWDVLELPLLQVLPDCPPDYKAHLRSALEDLAGNCPKRDVARRLMVMRDSLMR